MMILALDPATTCGWAAGRAGGKPEFGTRSFGGDGRSNGEVVGRFRNWLCHQCYELKPQLIAFESPYVPTELLAPRWGKSARASSGPPINPKTLRRLYGLASDIEAVAWELRIKCEERTAGQITKFFTGRFHHGGRAQKKMATVQMCRLMGWQVEDDNAADALALWAMMECEVAPGLSSRRGDGPLFIERRPDQPAIGRLTNI